MGFKHLLNLLKRFHVVILLSSNFVESVQAECHDDYGMRNAKDDNGDWQLYRFDGGQCLICFLGKSGPPGAELVLPCYDQNQPPINRIVVSHEFRRSVSVSDGKKMTLEFYNHSNQTCEMDNSTDTHLDTVHIMSTNFRRRVPSDQDIEIDIEGGLHSYRLRIVGNNVDSIICLTKVELLNKTMVTTPSATTVSRPATKEQTRRNVTFWLIVLIIPIVILGNFAVVGVVIRQRKLREHKQENHVEADRVDAQSKQSEDNKKRDTDVTTNAKYGQDPVNDHDDENHSYAEIDIKELANGDLIYNAAYKSFTSD